MFEICLLCFIYVVADFPRADGGGSATELVTREFKDLFDEVFPELVETFEESKAAAKSMSLLAI